MKKNTASQYFYVKAFNTAGSVTGDAANIDCNLSIDGANEASLAASATEIGGGVYRFALSQSETNGDALAFRPFSSTSGVEVLGMPSNLIYTTTDATLMLTKDIISTALSNLDEAETPVVIRGTNWSSSITTDDITEATAVHYMIKNADEIDNNAVLHVRLPINGGSGTDGIVRINAQSYTDASVLIDDAEITSSTSGDEVTYTMTCKGEASALFPPTTTIEKTSTAGYPRVSETSGYYTEWKLTGDNDRVLSQGRLKVLPDFVRATT